MSIQEKILPHYSDTTTVVASRIQYFIKKRRKPTQESSKVLSVTGYKIEFSVEPVQFVSPGVFTFSNEDTIIVSSQILNFLDKGTIKESIHG